MKPIELYKVRRELDSLAAYEMAKKHSQEGMAALYGFCEMLRNSGEITDFEKADYGFHVAVYKGSGLSLLCKLATDNLILTRTFGHPLRTLLAKARETLQRTERALE